MTWVATIIGVVVSTDRGLGVPVLREAARLSFAEIDQTVSTFAQSTRETGLKPDELEGGTFIITNGGVFELLPSALLVNQPQGGILGSHIIQERPIAMSGQEAALFLRHIKEGVENPVRMLLEV